MGKLQVLFEDDFLYLQITPPGMDMLYPAPSLAKLQPKEIEPLIRKIRKR